MPLQSNSSPDKAKAAKADGAKAPASAASAAAADKSASKGAAASKPKGGLGRRLRLRVGAEGARGDVVAGWPKQRVIATQQIEYRPGIATLAEAVVALEPLLVALNSAAGPIKGLACDVLIGDAWMLYDVVRADLRNLSPRAADDVVRSALADVAGVPPSDVVTRWQTQTGGQCTIACGMAAVALPTLQSLLKTHRLHAGEIVGEFVHEFNANRNRMSSRCAVISLVRETGSQLAVAADGVLAAMSFELGVRAPEELELRGRGLLRGAGMTVDADTKYFALLPTGWTPPAPWVALPTTA